MLHVKQQLRKRCCVNYKYVKCKLGKKTRSLAVSDLSGCRVFSKNKLEFLKNSSLFFVWVELKGRISQKSTRKLEFCFVWVAPNLSCVVHVVDNAGGRTDSTLEVKVIPGEISKRNLSTAIDNLATLEPSDFGSAFTPILESVAAVNCTLAPNCSAYNRQDCSAVPHTCGPCLSSLEFFGEAGHHNSRCAKRNEPSNIGGDISCFDDSSCPVFESCDEGNCVATMKQCSADCSGHGSCRFVVTSTREEMSNQFCAVGDTSCSAECLCDSGWFGLDCSRSTEDMQLDIELYERMVCLFADAVRSVERPSSEVVGSWLNQLSLLSQDVFLATNHLCVPWRFNCTFWTQ